MDDLSTTELADDLPVNKGLFLGENMTVSKTTS